MSCVAQGLGGWKWSWRTGSVPLESKPSCLECRAFPDFATFAAGNDRLKLKGIPWLKYWGSDPLFTSRKVARVHVFVMGKMIMENGYRLSTCLSPSFASVGDPDHRNRDLRGGIFGPTPLGINVKPRWP